MCNVLFFQIPVLHSLQSTITMASQCYILSDLNSMKCSELDLGTRLSERSRTFVTELACGGSHRDGASLKRFLETCGSTWLRLHVTDMLLANFSDCAVPLERRFFKNKALSLEKIVSFFKIQMVPSVWTTTVEFAMSNAEKVVLYVQRLRWHVWIQQPILFLSPANLFP